MLGTRNDPPPAEKSVGIDLVVEDRKLAIKHAVRRPTAASHFAAVDVDDPCRQPPLRLACQLDPQEFSLPSIFNGPQALH